MKTKYNSTHGAPPHNGAKTHEPDLDVLVSFANGPGLDGIHSATGADTGPPLNSMYSVAVGPPPVPLSPEEVGAEAGRRLAIRQKEEERHQLLHESQKRPKAKDEATEGYRSWWITAWGIVQLLLQALLFVGAIVASSGNAARFAVEFTNSWPKALLFTVVIPMIAVGLEFHAESLTQNRERFRRWLAWIFVVSALVFIGSFAWVFGLEPDPSTISTVLSGSQDFRLIIVSQILAELGLSFAAFGWIRQSIARLEDPRLRPAQIRDCLAETRRIERIEEIEIQLQQMAAESAAYRHRVDTIRAYNAFVAKFLKS